MGWKVFRRLNTFVSLTTRPNTVKPPFWLSRLAELSPKLRNHWLEAEWGPPE